MSSSRCRCRARRDRVRTAVLLALFLVACLPASCQRFAPNPVTEEASAASRIEPAVLVRLGSFERGAISRRLPVSADLEAIARADVPSEISGVVKAVLKRQGDPVVEGESVVLLDDEAVKLDVETKGILAEQAQGKVRQADLARREGEKQARQKELILEKVEAEYERLVQLGNEDEAGPDLVSKEEKEAKRIELEQAKIDASASALQRERYELEYEDAVRNAKAADVDLRTAEFRRSQTVLESPIDGVISYLRLKRGELVGTTTHVFSVVDVSRLEARLQVPQKELESLRAGLDVEIRCEVFPARTFRGRVDVVNPVVDETSGTVEVIASVEDSDGFLKPGLFVTGDIILDTREDAVLVPKKAVSYENSDPVIFLVKDGVAHRYIMVPGYSNRDFIEVRALTDAGGSPASADDGELVLVGHNNLKEGTRVETES